MECVNGSVNRSVVCAAGDAGVAEGGGNPLTRQQGAGDFHGAACASGARSAAEDCGRCARPVSLLVVVSAVPR